MWVRKEAIVVDWLKAAKALPYGGRDKIQCCGRDASMSIKHDSKGYFAYCHRCGGPERGFEPHGTLSLASILERKKVLENIKSGELKLPKDFTTDIPAMHSVWLLRAGVTLPIAKAYGFGYSAYWNRVILPVYDAKGLAAFTARSTIGERPKYIARYRDASAYFHARIELALPSAMDDPSYYSRSLVVTEDILSAVRVGRLRSSFALLGTGTGDTQIAAILAASRNGEVPVYLWLDGDRAGRVSSSKLRRTLELCGVRVLVISTDRDPKLYSNRVIHEILREKDEECSTRTS